MSEWLASGSEPPYIIAGLNAQTHGLCERYGCDYVSEAQGRMLGVQRKEFPGDFIASLNSGLLINELFKMADCHDKLLVIEGDPDWKWTPHEDDAPFRHVRYDNQDEMKHAHGAGWASFTRARLRGIETSAQLRYGCCVLWSTDQADTIRTILQWKEWLETAHTRPFPDRPKLQDPWGQDTSRLRKIWFLQAFPGVGPVMAENLLAANNWRIPLLYNGPPLKKIPGFGPIRTEKIIRFLESEGKSL